MALRRALVRDDGRDPPRIVTITGLPGVGKSRLLRDGLPDEAQPDLAVEAGPDPSEPRRKIEALPDDGRPRLIALVDWERTDLDIAWLRHRLTVHAAERWVITARSPLRLDGEHVIHVEPFPVPDPLADQASLLVNPAVQFFLDAAGGAARPAPTPSELRDIACVCALLGGLPLALELAAARTLTLSPASLRRMLERRMPASALHSVHPSVADAVAEAITLSCSTLDDDELALLDVLATFESPVDLEALETVAEVPCLHTVVQLAEAHLVEVDRTTSSTRYRLPDLIRSHLIRMLTTSSADRFEALLHRHDRWAVAVAEELAGRFATGPEHEVVRAAAVVREDLRVAAHRSLTAGDISAAATLVVALAPVWNSRTASPASQRLLAEVASAVFASDASQTAVPPAMSARLRAWRIALEADLVMTAPDATRLQAEADIAVEQARSVGGVVLVQVLELAIRATRVVAGSDEQRARCREALELASSLRLEVASARLELLAGMLAHRAGDDDAAVAHGVRAFRLAQHLDDAALTIQAVGHLLALPQRLRPAVLPGPIELIDMAVRTEDHRSLSWLRPIAAWEALQAGDTMLATRITHDALSLANENMRWSWTDVPLMCLVLIASSLGDHTEVARLHGCIDLELVTGSLVPRHMRAYEEVIAGTERAIGADTKRRLMGESTLWTRRRAVEHALTYADQVLARSIAAKPTTRTMRPMRDAAMVAKLTARELDVLRRLVAGDRNSDIATRLGITSKTAMHHTSSIYRKLQVRGRSDAVAWAVANGLTSARER